jgi:hypothetical protein
MELLVFRHHLDILDARQHTVFGGQKHDPHISAEIIYHF